ncbi:hypothetical protein Tco_0615144 [Tanacetum coccineum]
MNLSTVWFEIPRCTSWDKVNNLSSQSTPQVLSLFKEHTSAVTYPEEVEDTLGTPIEVEPLDQTQLEDIGVNTCNDDIPLSFREVPSFDELKPQPHPLPNCPSLDVSLGDERGPEPPIKPHSPESFRMKEVENLTIHTPPSPHVAFFHPKDMYCYYHPCLDDPKKHYGFKLGEGLSLSIKPKELERGMIKETHHLEHIIQQTHTLACRSKTLKRPLLVYTLSQDEYVRYRESLSECQLTSSSRREWCEGIRRVPPVFWCQGLGRVIFDEKKPGVLRSFIGRLLDDDVASCHMFLLHY